MRDGLMVALVAFGMAWCIALFVMWMQVKYQCDADGGEVVQNMWNMPVCAAVKR